MFVCIRGTKEERFLIFKVTYKEPTCIRENPDKITIIVELLVINKMSSKLAFWFWGVRKLLTMLYSSIIDLRRDSESLSSNSTIRRLKNEIDEAEQFKTKIIRVSLPCLMLAFCESLCVENGSSCPCVKLAESILLCLWLRNAEWTAQVHLWERKSCTNTHTAGTENWFQL